MWKVTQWQSTLCLVKRIDNTVTGYIVTVYNQILDTMTHIKLTDGILTYNKVTYNKVTYYTVSHEMGTCITVIDYTMIGYTGTYNPLKGNTLIYITVKGGTVIDNRITGNRVTDSIAIGNTIWGTISLGHSAPLLLALAEGSKPFLTPKLFAPS